jgi:hypothetical protein
MTDNVNSPAHYAEGWSNGAEVIDITENLNFNRGNAVKYIARAGKKDPEKELEDLQKAEFYLQREIARLDPSSGYPSEYTNIHFNVNSIDDAFAAIERQRQDCSFFAEHMAQPIQPRVWDKWDTIPLHTVVSDYDEDRWIKTSDSTFSIQWAGEGDWFSKHESTFTPEDGFGPFTEVVESA